MLSYKKTKNILGIISLLTLICLPFLFNLFDYLSIPSELTTFNNHEAIPIHQTENIDIIADDTIIMKQNEQFYPTATGQAEIVYKKANIPIKKTSLEIIKNKTLIPGGQSVGVKLNSLGVIVVGHHIVPNKSDALSPGEEADILVGDIILEMNDIKIKRMEDVKPIVNKAGKANESINTVIKRGNQEIKKKLTPSFNDKKDQYQIGLYIRDSATGIGTISFFDEDTSHYGALGHIISDKITKKPIEIYDGKIVRSTVTSIEKGNQGIPGEKQASFSINDKQLGNITKNSPFGIFGKMNKNAFAEINKEKAIPIGLANEIEKGPAEILTVVEGEKVEKFAIEIVNSSIKNHPSTKGIIIKVVDEKLLNKTGGIVQGMSGSPIIQNGKIIGAVTHVFVNDPTSGYGVHIEWMLKETGVDLYEQENKAS